MGTASQSALVASPQALPVRQIVWSDVMQSVQQGWVDFQDKPSYLLVLCIVYPIVGLLLIEFSVGANLFPLIYPVVMGFALIGPLVATGLYQISRRREQGYETTWTDTFTILQSPSIASIALLSLFVFVIYLAWLATAQGLYDAVFDDSPQVSMVGFFSTVLTTSAGWVLIVVGNAIGFVFALIVFTISVVSFPLLVDRPVSLSVAVRTSVAAVRANPRVMIGWAGVVAVALVLGLIPFMLGLAVVMPVMGHASWHLYRKLIAPQTARAPVPEA